MKIIVDFYERDCSGEQLVKHRNMFLDIAEQNDAKVSNLSDVVSFFLKDKRWCIGIVPEYI